MKDALQYFDQLRVLNQERLTRLHKIPIVAVAFDVHGFTYGKDEELNTRILEEQARLLSKGCVLAAVTGFGDRIHLVQTTPLIPILLRFGLDPEDVPLYLSTRNGALTTHAFTDELIDHHPITPEIYEAVTAHPLIMSIHNLTRTEVKAGLAREYVEIQESLGFELHPRRNDFPGIRHDWHPRTKAGYQLTVIYEPEYLDQIGPHDDGFKDVSIITDYNDGVLPDNPHKLAPILKRALAESGIDVATNTAASHAEIDIALPGIDKSHGCAVLLPRIAEHWGISESEVRQKSIGGGDSPEYNDSSLIKFFNYGVTNIDYWEEGNEGPIVLDYENIKNTVGRTFELFRRIKVEER